MLKSKDSEPAEKSALQLRAEEAYQRFVATGRKPVVIEFAGVPKAGKSKYPPAEPGALVVSRSKRPVERGRCAAT